MREFLTQDGNRIHLPDTVQRVDHPRGEHELRFDCDCHARMGNDFWFLPKGSCIRKDGTCNGVR